LGEAALAPTQWLHLIAAQHHQSRPKPVVMVRWQRPLPGTVRVFPAKSVFFDKTRGENMASPFFSPRKWPQQWQQQQKEDAWVGFLKIITTS